MCWLVTKCCPLPTPPRTPRTGGSWSRGCLHHHPVKGKGSHLTPLTASGPFLSLPLLPKSPAATATTTRLSRRRRRCRRSRLWGSLRGGESESGSFHFTHRRGGAKKVCVCLCGGCAKRGAGMVERRRNGRLARWGTEIEFCVVVVVVVESSFVRVGLRGFLL